MTNTLNIQKPSDPDWYHVDKKGRCIGWMWPEDFKRDLEAIWGSRKGIQGFTNYTGLSRTTVERYCNGSAAIPRHIALLSQALLLLIPQWNAKQTARNKVRGFPVVKAPWLPREIAAQKSMVAIRPYG